MSRTFHHANGKYQVQRISHPFRDGIRKAADVTQVKLAKAMGVAQSEISRIESGPDILLSTLVATSPPGGNRCGDPLWHRTVT